MKETDVHSQNEPHRVFLALDPLQGHEVADEECQSDVSGHDQVRQGQERLRIDLWGGLVSKPASGTDDFIIARTAHPSEFLA
jgi:hypothetical protein